MSNKELNITLLLLIIVYIILSIIRVIPSIHTTNTNTNTRIVNNYPTELVIPIQVKLTNYTTCSKETDNTPNATASGHKITLSDRIIAISPDLQDKYNLKFGDYIIIDSKTAPYFNGRWIIEDVSSPKIHNTIEICIPNPNIYMRFAIDNQTILIPIKNH